MVVKPNNAASRRAHGALSVPMEVVLFGPKQAYICSIKTTRGSRPVVAVGRSLSRSR